MNIGGQCRLDDPIRLILLNRASRLKKSSDRAGRIARWRRDLVADLDAAWWPIGVQVAKALAWWYRLTYTESSYHYLHARHEQARAALAAYTRGDLAPVVKELELELADRRNCLLCVSDPTGDDILVMPSLAGTDFSEDLQRLIDQLHQRLQATRVPATA